MTEPPRHDRGTSPADTVARAFAALGIEPAHGPEAEAAARAWAEPAAARGALDDPALVDLEALPFVTIDNPGSRDLDQALHIESATDGPAWRVRYALADAAHYVRPGEALFAAALARGTSYYTPGTVAPMLPRVLSEDLVSLEPGVARRALVFEIGLDEQARVLATTVLRARVRSRAQLTYRGVQAFLDGAARADEPIEEAWATTLRSLRRVGHLLLARARERGVVAFDRREVDVEVAGSPPRFVARERERLDTEEWNAQISLLCNTEGAALLAGLDAHAAGAAAREAGGARDTLQPIYRVHDAPLDKRLRELRLRLDAWVKRLALDERFRWHERQSLADYVDALPSTPRDAGRVRAVQRQVLVVQRASEFRAEPGRHHALAVDGYARFSSPMREVVGIFTHRELLQALSAEADGGADGPDAAAGGAVADQAPGDGAPGDEAADDGAVGDGPLRDAVIEAANAAKRRQKALDKRIGFAIIADLLEADLAREPVPAHAGTVLGVRAGGGGHLYVGIDDLALDLKVYGEDLERRHGTPYAFGELAAEPQEAARPVFALGDAVTLRAAGYDEARARFTLDLVPRGEAARRERRRARPA